MSNQAAVQADEPQSIVAASFEDFGVRAPVISVHFMPLKTVRPFKTSKDNAYRTVYEIPACKTKDSAPEMLIVLDGYDRVYMGADSTPRYQNIPEKAMNIAKDIVQEATGGSPGGPDDIRPSIWISRVKVPKKSEMFRFGSASFEKEFPEFTEEVGQYRARQWKWCENKVAQGDTWHSKRLPIEINELHRLAAKYIGASAHDHPWIEITSFAATVDCPFCKTGVAPDAVICPNCRQIINPQRMKEIQQELAAQAK